MSKYSYEEKVVVIKAHKEGKGNRIISREYGIPQSTVKLWCRNYELFGEEIFKQQKKQTKWSVETKTKAVQEYLTEKISIGAICKKYRISTSTVFRRWLKMYNGYKEFKERNSAKGEIYMTKGRKTTQEERATIVAFCIEHGKDYGLTVETYKVSYQQIYSWVKKYEEKEVDGLTDRRGKAKSESELSESERLRQENKILQAKIKDQEMEIALLKKLRELR
ncbi:MAG: helix-turn-helix domain-containing protein [Acutalibacteraceae bacterium]|nr:helix-turn-helix domain-containing protein [Acutalibacteraceae bacterium]